MFYESFTQWGMPEKAHGLSNVNRDLGIEIGG